MNIDGLYKTIYYYISKLDIEILPVFLNGEFFEAITLPQHNMVILFDDNESLDYKRLAHYQNKFLEDKGYKVYRVRTLDCIPLNDNSFDYYIENYDNSVVLRVINYLYADIMPASSVLDRIDCVENIECFYGQSITNFNRIYTDKSLNYINTSKMPFISGNVIYDGFFIGQWFNKMVEISLNAKIDNIEIVVSRNLCQWDNYYSMCSLLIKQGVKVYQIREYNGYKIRSWLREQKSVYKEGKLSQDRIERLSKLGISWNEFETKWNDAFNLLCQYLKENNTNHISKDVIYKGFKLGSWMQTQKKDYNTGKLRQDRVEKIKSVGYLLEDYRNNEWFRMYNVAKEYFNEFGTAYIPRRHSYHNENLGRWIMIQIRQYRANKLSEERYRLLEQLNLWNDIPKKNPPLS